MDARVAATPPDGNPVAARLDRQVTLPSGRRLGVAEFGCEDGYPVIACHGAPASRLMFEVADEAARALSIRLIAFDRPGYGLSPLDYGATLLSRTEVFAGLPDALGLEQFALIGVSGGAPYATALAAHLGDRVSALGLISPLGPVADLARRSAPAPIHLSTTQRAFFLDLPNHPWLLRANAEIAMRGFRAMPRVFAGLFTHLLPATDGAIISRPRVAESMIAMTLEATRNGMAGGIADIEIYGEPWHVDFSAITAPAVLWQGLADPVVPVEVALGLGALIPECRIERIEDGGHFWVYDNITSTLQTVLDLAAIEGRA